VKKILVMEDDEILNAGLCYNIQKKEMLPVSVYSIEAAKEKLKKGTFDLILLDVNLPDGNGFDFAKEAMPKYNTPFIFLTAHNLEEEIIKGLQLGADDYIVKPFVLPNLLARIEALIRRSRWNKNKENRTVTNVKAAENISKLTQRELEILKMVSKGASNADIAEKLFVKEVTIKTHLNSIYKKLNVENRVQAVLLAIETEIVKE